jgi:signal transduction histidine kinase
MKWRLPHRVPFRLRVFFRAAFALLAIATLALSLSVLRDEKQRGRQTYAEGLAKSQAQIAARLRHPTGQLALLNPSLGGRGAVPVRPLLLPFSALDFDDRAKALQAVELTGCAVQYASGATLCAAVGSSASAGGFVYAVASLAAGPLVAHHPPALDLTAAHRVRITLRYRDIEQSSIAVYQIASDGRGRLAGFEGDSPLPSGARPLRDFRGWMWQEPSCTPGETAADPCLRRSFVSLRVPVEAWRQSLVNWPPPALDGTEVHLQVLAPGDGPALFDSDAADASLPFTLADLVPLLLPGETLRIRRAGQTRDVAVLTGAVDGGQTISPWIAQLIRNLPVDGFDAPVTAHETIATPLARYDVTLTGDVRGVNRALAAAATRMIWTVGAMLTAILATWLAIEVVLIRRITLLTRRAAAVSLGVRGGAQGVAELDLSDLRGGDELGVLAQGLKDLLARVNDDLRRERIRTEQAREQWHAVGHEIVSPLQSLKALHGQPDDPAARYIARMQDAVRVLYGQASPSEAFEAKTLALEPLDLDAFLAHVAINAHYIGIADVAYVPRGAPLPVRADEHALEDVIGHVLRNADRHRLAGTPITLTLADDATTARVGIRNQGPTIAEDRLTSIFEYGVSDAAPDMAGRRGQGLFVARTYLAKMGATIAACNETDGVSFVVTLPHMA